MLSKEMTHVIKNCIERRMPISVSRAQDWRDKVEKLEEYATHKPGCHENGNECICGLDALLAGG